MSYIINDRKPEAVFHIFEDICKIPHGSGNEAEISAYIAAFALEHGLEHYRDELNNVFIVKPATKGFEDKPAIMLQGHMDMVCEKNNDTVHDFLRDPLDIYVENGWLRARGTTLGGDNGIAVAMMLAILGSDDLSHPRLECLFTVSEETGLDGANGFDYSKVSARKLINLDSEEEGIAVAGCAGGLRISFVHDCETVPYENKLLKLEISGLAGGHSGAEIHMGLANANKLMGRVLNTLYNEEPFNLVSLEGGNKSNAITRECEAVIATHDPDKVKESAAIIEKTIKRELCKADAKFKLRIAKAKTVERMLTYKDTGKIISLLALVPYGVRTMSPKMQGLVESSVNPGVLRLTDGRLSLNCSSRSSVESVMNAMKLEFETLAKVLDLGIECGSRYPGWEYKDDSILQRQFISTYKELFGDDKTPTIAALHAGLECGIISEALGGDIDAISIGPNMRDIHSPTESLDLASVERVYKQLTALIAL